MREHKRRMDPSMEDRIKHDHKVREESCLSEFASESEDGERRKGNAHDDVRGKYSRDADRIMHTFAYSRYIDKTQVFFFEDNDHITHRVLHVQMVSKIGRTIGRSLHLNEDLIDAIALGHDIGHVPFGHIGETYLSDICQRNGIGRFLHNVESAYLLQEIEDCNLTLQVVDGIVSHNGEVHVQELHPNRDKTWDSLDNEVDQLVYGGPELAPNPMTLEGCVVRFADVIAYLGRDIQDAILVGLIGDESEIPEVCRDSIGTTNSDIINSLVVDLIENSFDQDFISFSKEVSDIVRMYRDFNSRRIYEPEMHHAEEMGLSERFEVMFDIFLKALDNEERGSTIFTEFIDFEWVNPDYFKGTTNAEKTRDYIAGMTDRYFDDTWNRITEQGRANAAKAGSHD